MAKKRVSVFPGSTGTFWKPFALLLAFQAIGWGAAACLAYVIAAPELAKDYYSAHQTVKTTGDLLVPALAASAGVGFLIVGVVSGISLRRHARTLFRPLDEAEGILRQLAGGQIPALPAAGSKQPRAADEAVALLTPLRERIQQVQRISKDIQKSVLALNYRASGSAELTLKDLRGIAGQLDALAKDLDEAVTWFES